jgi:signal transduction histidine kinase
MGRSPRTIWGVLVLAWLALAVWQFLSWRHEQFLIRETVHQQAHSVMNALTGGIRSHRRLGRFVQMQLSGILEGLAATPDVLAVEVLTGDGHRLVSAGDTTLLKGPSPMVPGGSWEPVGFRLVEQFEVEGSPVGESHGHPAGPGGGFGFGRLEQENELFDQLRSEGGVLLTVLLLDRSRADALFAGAIRSHGIAAIAGGLVLIGLGIAWRSNLRLVAERARSELLELETQHYRDLGQSAAGLAHETRNPLGLIRGWAERLATSVDDPQKQKDQARILIEECDRVTARINEFLAFTRPYQPETEAVSPSKLAEELRDILQPDLESKQITLNILGQDESVRVAADRELLRQALFNLLQNAIQSSPRSAEVEIRIGGDASGTCCIEVADRGPGVAAEQVESLFSPYFTTREAGTGLGLAIVRKIAFAHGWAACYNPRDGGGSIFSLEGLTDGSQTNHSDC